MEHRTSTLFDEQTPGLSQLQLYEGKVVINDDPDHLGRIKVRVAQFFDGIEDADLPWAIPTFEHPDGATAESGIICIPKVDSKVIVNFQGGSPFHPVYRGYTVDKKTKLEEADTNYPDRAVIRFKNGLLIVIDTSTDEVFLRNPGDLHALVEGDLDVTVMGNYTFRCDKDMVQVVNGDYLGRVYGDHKEITHGNRTEQTVGNDKTFIQGTSGHYVDQSYTMVASRIDENPSSGAPGAPAEPTQAAPYVWPGILRGGLPKALWRILHFW